MKDLIQQVYISHFRFFFLNIPTNLPLYFLGPSVDLGNNSYVRGLG